MGNSLFLLVVLCTLCNFSISSGASCPKIPKKVHVDPKQLPWDKVDALLTSAASHSPGFIAVAVLNGEIVWHKGWGKRDPFAKHTTTPTMYDWVKIASLSKTFTSLLTHSLVDKGHFDLDDAIEKHWHEFSIKNPYPNAKPVTIRECASQTSGIPRDLPQFHTWTPEEGMKMLSNYYLLLPQYTRFHYSNEAFNLLGYTLPRAVMDGRNYTQLMQDLVFNPLGLTNATFLVDGNTIAHMATGTTSAGTKAPVGQADWGLPCGGIIAAPADIAKYMIALMDEKIMADSGVLSSSMRRQFLTPAINLRDGTYAIGYPWEMNYTAGMWTYSKQGEESGFRSSMSFVPDLGLGVFTVATKSETPSPDGTVWTIPVMDMLIPVVKQKMWDNQPIPTLPPDVKDLVGMYGLPKVGIRVSTTGPYVMMQQEPGGALFNLTAFQPDPAKPPIPDVLRGTYTHPHQQCRFLDDGADEALCYFRRDKQGKVYELEFAGIVLEKVKG